MQDELNMLKGDKKIPFRILMKKTMKYIKPEIKAFILAFFLLVLGVVVDIISPLFISNITNEISSDTMQLANIIKWSLCYFGICLFAQVVIYFEAMLLQKIGQKIIYNLRMDVFTHIENMSQNQFDEMPVGSLVTRVANYTSSMSDLFTNTLVNILKNAFTVIGVYAIMFFISWKLSLLMLAFVVVVFVVSYIFSKYINKTFRLERKNISDLNTYLSENLSGMKITQIFNQESLKEKEFNEKNENLRKSRYKVIVAFALYRPFITLLYILSIALSFYVGVKTGLNSGEIVAFYLYLSKFFNPIQSLADQLNNLTKALTASERLFNLLDVAPEVRDKENAIEIDHFDGKIEFKNVWFAYKPDHWILRDVSFVIEPKQTVAFVGATGAGKTTILSLIVRNYEIQKGEILIDGINVNDIKIKSLRNCIGQMLQDVFLFSGSIRTNITLHEEAYSDEEINEVCKYVNADKFIDKLENGLDEEVIERGENFSQGQRQLISFARTVLHKPQILILDEATANIDTETEVLIQDSLQKMMNIGTMLIVAHRLSTIQHSDKIIVLHKGKIVESGNHQELLANHGRYYNLYQLQMKQSEE